MFVAYLVPKEDYHLVLEDGLHFVCCAATKEEAEAKMRDLFDKEQAEDNARSVALGYEPEPYRALEDDYVLHSQEA